MADINNILESAAGNFSIAEGVSLIQPLLIFILGMSIYSFFIFKFYRFVARRDLFKDSVKDKDGTPKTGFKQFWGHVVYSFKHILFLPILIFFWFIVLSIILAFLSRQDTAQLVLLVSLVLIATIRVMAYYNEDLSRDLAKMLPFALLGVFLVDISYFSAETSLQAIKQIPSLWNIMIYYLLFLILLEFILRIVFGIYRKIKHKN